jgi:amino-acid N-acetyltransferase
MFFPRHPGNVEYAGDMIVRPARMPDALAICQTVNYHAERGRMLHLSLESAYERLRNFLVAEEDGRIIGCVAVEIAWADLAEVRSLAVHPERLHKGVGRGLMTAALADARQMAVQRLFALTYETEFFAKCGFKVIDKDLLPSKVWSACILCPRRTACDEVAMMLELNGARNE